MEVKKFIGKVLPDGHLSLPDDTSRQVGMIFEVILLPVKRTDIYSFTERIADENDFSYYTESDIERIIHESRGVKEWKKSYLIRTLSYQRYSGIEISVQF